MIRMGAQNSGERQTNTYTRILGLCFGRSDGTMDIDTEGWLHHWEDLIFIYFYIGYSFDINFERFTKAKR